MKNTLLKNTVGVGMPKLAMPQRIQGFEEVAIGYTEEEAKLEAARCLQCKKPKCKRACPAGVLIPEFISLLLQNNIPEAYKIIRTTNSFPAICGRVCPQENQCEGSCILNAKGSPVAIGRLERFVADQASKLELGSCVGLTKDNICSPIDSSLRVACIGSGPASLSAAGYLAAHGIAVTVYEAQSEPGGILTLGIPKFRLPKEVILAEIESLQKMGVLFKTNWIAGVTGSIQQLKDEGYKAIFIGIGAGYPYKLGIPGEEYKGVFIAHEYLKGIRHSQDNYSSVSSKLEKYKGRRVTVFGAGNVAMDASRTALRLGAESVCIIYRRTRAEMPARHEEIHFAEEEGVKFMEFVAPISFQHDENYHLSSVKLQKMSFGEVDTLGRRSIVPIPGEVFEYKTDLAIVAIGSKADPLFFHTTPGLDLSEDGYIAINEVGETSIQNVFAGGDIVTSATTVVSAMVAGRLAAQEIVNRLIKV